MSEEPSLTAAPHMVAIDATQRQLAEANSLKDLPADYCDVTHGPLAGIKRWIKKKLLNNFRRNYVDVLSRQQTAFNTHVLEVLTQLTETVSLLAQERPNNRDGTEVRKLQQKLEQLSHRQRRLTRELRRLRCDFQTVQARQADGGAMREITSARS